VRVAGVVVARQRPGTAGGVVFMLLEDEHDTVNLVIPPPVYARHRLVVRTEPLVLAEGRLERFAAGGGTVNVVVRSLRALEAPPAGGRPARLAEVRELSRLDERERRRIEEEERRAASGGGAAAGQEADFRAVAPPASSFARGRRR
jgi:error-prone DNA polymerase